jgi:hypothetical protein
MMILIGYSHISISSKVCLSDLTNSLKYGIIYVGEVQFKKFSGHMCFQRSHVTNLSLRRTMSFNFHDSQQLQEQQVKQQRSPSDVPLIHFLQENLDALQASLDALKKIDENVRLNASLTADLCAFFREPPPPPESFDLFEIIPLWKVGFGSNWIPNKQHRQYLYVYAPVATAILCSTSLGPPFVLTIPQVTFPDMWNKLDLPDQSSITLDATATSNMMTIYVRKTQVHAK